MIVILSGSGRTTRGCATWRARALGTRADPGGAAIKTFAGPWCLPGLGSDPFAQPVDWIGRHTDLVDPRKNDFDIDATRFGAAGPRPTSKTTAQTMSSKAGSPVRAIQARSLACRSALMSRRAGSAPAFRSSYGSASKS